MDYISVREAAENWSISVRRVQKLCEEGRVPGARRFGLIHLSRAKRDVLPMLRRAWELKRRVKKSKPQSFCLQHFCWVK